MAKREEATAGTGARGRFQMPSETIEIATFDLGPMRFRAFATIRDYEFVSELGSRDMEDREFMEALLGRHLVEPDAGLVQFSSLSDESLLLVGSEFIAKSLPERQMDTHSFGSARSGLVNHVREEVARVTESLRSVWEGVTKPLNETMSKFTLSLSPSIEALLAPPKVPYFDGVNHDFGRAGFFGSPINLGPEAPAAYAPPLDEPWARVERQVVRAAELLETASVEEDFQSVGLLCREVMISLASAVYDPAKHPPLDGKDPSATDAKRKLDAYIAARLVGSSDESLRKLLRATFDHANAVQHDRNCDRLSALVCLQATVQAVSLVGSIEGVDVGWVSVGMG